MKKTLPQIPVLLIVGFGTMFPTAWAFSPLSSFTSRDFWLSTVLRSSEPLFDDPIAPSDLPIYTENTIPRIQAIQPGMQEPPYYTEPPPPGIQPTDGRSSEDDGRELGFRVYNGEAMSRTDKQPTARSDTTNRLRDTRGSIGEDQQRIQGNSLRTYDNPVGGTDTSVHLSTQGRPIHADMQMWSGPNNTPKSVRLYSQDGNQYGVSTTFSSSGSQQANSVSIRNEGNMEFPLTTRVTSSSAPSIGPSIGSNVGLGMVNPYGGGQQPQIQQQQQQQQQQRPPRAVENEGGIYIQGEGMVRTFPISANVQSVQVILQSAGSSGNRKLPVQAKVELLQGPNNVKTSAEIYDDGMHGDYFETVMDTPGYTSSLRITNTGPMTYPFYALVVPFTFGDPKPLDNDSYSGVTSSRFGPDGQFRG